jgi:hypothetical protein
VLFDTNGRRHPEKELYATPVPRTGGEGGKTPVPRTGPPVPRTGPPVPKDSPPNNPLIGVPSSSVSIQRGDVQKHALPNPKKIPAAERAEDRRDRLETSKARQLEELKRRQAVTA